ncbi:hypothetical protein GM3708_374 [Geminocystis sp. NIES-3708]|nr:hypothetical protein GM3708_374 [Geminocystis sp. NIES-3708]
MSNVVLKLNTARFYLGNEIKNIEFLNKNNQNNIVIFVLI